MIPGLLPQHVFAESTPFHPLTFPEIPTEFCPFPEIVDGVYITDRLHEGVTVSGACLRQLLTITYIAQFIFNFFTL